jgi:Sulfotransferase family
MIGPARARPLFVGGCGRSGTTLAVDLLGMHSRLSPVYETAFVIDLPPLLFRDTGLSALVVADRIRDIMAAWSRELPHQPHEKKSYERYWHGPHHVLFDRAFALARTEALIERFLAAEPEDGFRDFVGALFAEHARLDGKPGWINKTPRYVLMLGTLLHLFPDMIYIDCVRDPRDAVASMLSRSWGPKSAEEGARFWLACVEKAAAFRRKAPDRHVEIRYEALLAEPRAVLAATLARLGLADESEAMLARYRERVALRPDRGAERDPAVAGPVAEIAGAAMARLGYR